MASAHVSRALPRTLVRRMASPAGSSMKSQETKLLLVVAACLVNEKGQVLLAERPKSKHMGGRYEFPGGKVEAGERPEVALTRELQEELGITCGTVKPLTFCSHAYEAFHLLMPLYLCRSWEGVPTGREGQQLVWAGADDLEEYDMPPADIPLLPFVKRALKGEF